VSWVELVYKILFFCFCMFDAGVVPGLKALLESGPLSFFKIFLSFPVWKLCLSQDLLVLKKNVYRWTSNFQFFNRYKDLWHEIDPRWQGDQYLRKFLRNPLKKMQQGRRTLRRTHTLESFKETCWEKCNNNALEFYTVSILILLFSSMQPPFSLTFAFLHVFVVV
jgi:hypothetical protein